MSQRKQTGNNVSLLDWISKNVKILIKSLKFGSPIKLQILGRIFLMRLLMRGGFKFFQVYSLAKIPD